LDLPAEVEVTVCEGCGAYRLHNRWELTVGDPVSTAIEKTVRESVRVVNITESGKQLLRPSDAEGIRISIEPNLKDSSAKIKAFGKVHPLQAQAKSEEAYVRIKLKTEVCRACSLKRAKHHEAILQVRGKISKEALSKLMVTLNDLAEEAGAKDPSDFIADVKRQKEGLDYYVSSLSLARKMASLLKVEFGATISESAKLVGQTRNGRKKYRVSMLARLRGAI
jgi:NMD protein affecting ribosome stability and mRNA decay